MTTKKHFELCFYYESGLTKKLYANSSGPVVFSVFGAIDFDVKSKNHCHFEVILIMKSQILLFVLLIFLSAGSVADDSRKNLPVLQEGYDFRAQFGPWFNLDSPQRKRVVSLHIGNIKLDECIETITDKRFSDLDLCSFYRWNDDSKSFEVDRDVAMTTLYHRSGMNRDGSKRRFYHAWFGKI